jgi:hypothetical protein
MILSFTKSEFFRKNIHPMLARFPLYDYLLLRKKSYLKSTGWFKSFSTGQSVNLNGEPIPWFTYGAIELLNDRLPDDAIVFEYGCGLGTKWWANKAKEVDAVEHDEEWFNLISKKLPENVNLLHKELENNYAGSIHQMNKLYDVIIIDGKNRIDCLNESIDKLTGRGVLVFDDTDREHFKQVFEILGAREFRYLTFKGFGPIEFIECETTIFYRNGNLLNI